MPLPDRLPPFPLRRMIAVTVMYAGLIGPALLGSLQLASFGGPGVVTGFLLIVLSAWLCYNLASLWKGRLWAWSAGVVPFAFGAVVGAAITAGALLSWEPQALAVGAAVLSYFGCGLGALYSLKGAWLRRLEWKPARDPFARIDKAATADALKAASHRARHR